MFNIESYDSLESLESIDKKIAKVFNICSEVREFSRQI